MVVAWIVAVWLLSLAVFVALRAYGARTPRSPRAGHQRPAQLPTQRQPSDSRARITDRG
ncbi:MAG TPA: hypothetical protein VFG72_13125 [Marmoricola sp.]|nr:hypothetical protein [Marmoricola sp.]